MLLLLAAERSSLARPLAEALVGPHTCHVAAGAAVSLPATTPSKEASVTSTATRAAVLLQGKRFISTANIGQTGEMLPTLQSSTASPSEKCSRVKEAHSQASPFGLNRHAMTCNFSTTTTEAHMPSTSTIPKISTAHYARTTSFKLLVTAFPDDLKPTRNPIILCHGLFGYDKIGPDSLPFFQLRYWRGVYEALLDLGCEVFMPQVGTVSSIRTRAHELKAFLDYHVPGRQVNIVAHSMGGLDARYLITHLMQSATPQTSFSVASLTTIATPHRGSPFMDWCRDTLGLGSTEHFRRIEAEHGDPVASQYELERKERESLRRLRLEHQQQQMDNEQPPGQHPNAAVKEMVKTAVGAHPLIKYLTSRLDAPAFSNLTTDYCHVFNKLTPNIPDVHYSSYAAVTEVSRLAPLYLPHQIIKQTEGPNDGIVSLASATWGQFEGLAGDIDHWELIPPKIRGIRWLVHSASNRWANTFRAASPNKSTDCHNDGRNNNDSNLSSAVAQKFDSGKFYMQVASRLHSKGY